MGDYITEEYFLTNNLLMGLLYYTAEMQVLILILNLGDKQTKWGDYNGRAQHPRICKWQNSRSGSKTEKTVSISMLLLPMMKGI